MQENTYMVSAPKGLLPSQGDRVKTQSTRLLQAVLNAKKKLMMEIVRYETHRETGRVRGKAREQLQGWPLGEGTFDLRPDKEGAVGRDSIGDNCKGKSSEAEMDSGCLGT